MFGGEACRFDLCCVCMKRRDAMIEWQESYQDSPICVDRN